MTAIDFLSEVQARGITLVVDGDNLRCQGDNAALTPDLIAELREHKTEILSLMICGQCRTPLTGPVNKLWRVMNDGETTYLCSPRCVHQAWPWRLGATPC
jgi:hypothetical protein